MSGIQIDLSVTERPTLKLGPSQTQSWALPLCASAIGAILWWLHAVLNELYPPNETALDDVLYLTVSLCKLTVIITTPFLIALACKLLYRDRRTVRRCVIFWIVGLAIMISALAVNHDRIAKMLNNETIRYHYISPHSSAASMGFVGREEWLPRWQSGQILAIEVLFGLVFITVLSVVAYYVGAKETVAIWLTVGLLALTIAWPLVFGLWVSDYDEFLGGIYSDSVALDLSCFFVAIDPATELSMIAFFGFILTTILGIRPKLRAARGQLNATGLSDDPAH